MVQIRDGDTAIWTPNLIKKKYFFFILQTPQIEELSLLGIQLAARFLFHTGFHTKKTLRGASTDWYVI